MGGRGGSGAKGGGGGGSGNWSLARVGRLQSGNEPGLTVAQEYHQKEVLGKYSENDYARAGAAGPREYQRQITESVRKNGILNPAQVNAWTETKNGLSEGYHRYAAARQLGFKTMPVSKGSDAY